MAEEGEITQEELFEQHRAEIEALFDEKGFFRRLADMFRGLKKPRNSREYKLARTELQRLAAPLVAILLPVVGVVVLIVVTSVSGKVGEHITVDIAQIQEDDAPPEDEPDPPEEPIDMTQDIDVTVDIATDVPTPEMANPAPPSPDPGGEPDKVAAAPSPVMMSAVSGTVKMRGLGDGTAGGFGTLIGSGGKAQSTEGCLIGVIVDFKSKPDGSPRSEYKRKGNGWDGPYWDDVKTLIDGNFSPASMSKFFVPPKRVALNHLFLEQQDAANGPKAFGVADVMKPSGFVVYYSGKIRATEKARYRFVGFFDDMMVVRLDRKAVLESNWGYWGRDAKGNATGWSSPSPDHSQWPCHQPGGKLAVGDWFAVAPDKEYFLELLVGENPGGKIGGALYIQKEGETYEMDGKRPVLPIFASRPLSLREKENIREHSFPMRVDSPVFNARKGAGKEAEAVKKMTKDDVSVTVDI